MIKNTKVHIKMLFHFFSHWVSIKVLPVAIIATLVSCSNYAKLYKRGITDIEEFSGSVKYETVFDLIIVPVEMNGETYRFLFDTGAPNVISKELKEALNLKPITYGQVGDSQGNSQSLGYVKLPTLQIGGVGFSNTVALTADLKLSPEINCLNIDGILGANLMKLAFWKIDFKKQELFFSSDKQGLIPVNDQPYILPFLIKTSFTPVVSLTVNNTQIKHVTFDTGYAGYLSLGGVMPEPDSILAHSFGYGSSGLYGSNFDTVLFVNTQLQIDSFSQNIIAKYEKGNTKKLLGINFMSQFTLILDWELNQVEFYVDSLEEQSNESYGFSPKWLNNKLIIGTLHQEFLPIKNGLKVGDEIKIINQWDFSEPSLETYCDMIIALRSKTVKMINIVLIDGREYSFALEDISTKD